MIFAYSHPRRRHREAIVIAALGSDLLRTCAHGPSWRGAAASIDKFDEGAAEGVLPAVGDVQEAVGVLQGDRGTLIEDAEQFSLLLLYVFTCSGKRRDSPKNETRATAAVRRGRLALLSRSQVGDKGAKFCLVFIRSYRK